MLSSLSLGPLLCTEVAQMKSVARRWFVGSMVLMSAFSAGIANAQVSTSKPLTLVVGFAPGAATDALARAIQPILQKELDQNVIVENVPGAGGSIAIQKILRSSREANTVFFGAPTDTVLTPMQIKGAKYKAEDLVLVGSTAYTSLVLLARPTLKANTVEELVALLKSPEGKSVSYSSSGYGSLYHLTMEQLQSKVGSNMVHVPFPGLGAQLTATVGGQVDLALVPLVGPVVGMINSGKVKALAVTASKRNPQVPKVPSVDESASMRGLHRDALVGIFVPKGYPRASLEALNKAFNKAQSTEEFKNFASVSGVAPLEIPQTLEQADEFYRKTTQEYRNLATLVNLQPQ